MAYKVIASKEVEEAIDNIHDYIATVLLSPQSAKNTVAKILDSLKSLEIFPEAWFDADEKIGVKINSKYHSRGKVINQYVLLYFIDQNRNTVFLSHLFHTKSDYVTLLQKENKKRPNTWDNFLKFISSETLIFGTFLLPSWFNNTVYM